ncbi:hypothetical protein KUCAC02_006639 [Chaenocephalus aceratus]|uniref:Uncharacterized protein n=1 Tax=Chaenocephalus aceratus TaxID=36190 RepID=A0ACB9VT12_CHAAC|nr:hypothetical protein KUCAC02_006639 [Chaenocephalus aceratus]
MTREQRSHSLSVEGFAVKRTLWEKSLSSEVKVSAGVRAGFSGPFSATHGHGVTIRIRYFHVSNVQCSSLKSTCSWDTSILCDDRPSFNLHLFYFYLPTAIPLTFLSLQGL